MNKIDYGNFEEPEEGRYSKKFLYTYMNKTLYLIVSNIKIKNLFVTEKIFVSINNF